MLMKIFVIEAIKKSGRRLLAKAVKKVEDKNVIRDKLGFDSIDEFMKTTPEELKKRGL